MINGIVALFIGIYLVMVLWRDREGQMFSLISEQTGFFKWGGALLTLAYLYNAVGGKAGQIIKGFIFLALTGFILFNGEKLFGEVQTIFDAEKSGGSATDKKYFN